MGMRGLTNNSLYRLRYILVLVVLAFLMLPVIFNPSIVGFGIKEIKESYKINETFSSSTIINIPLSGELAGVSLDAFIEGNGSVIVSLVGDTSRVIYSSMHSEGGITAVTGLVVSNTSSNKSVELTEPLLENATVGNLDNVSHEVNSSTEENFEKQNADSEVNESTEETFDNHAVLLNETSENTAPVINETVELNESIVINQSVDQNLTLNENVTNEEPVVEDPIIEEPVIEEQNISIERIELASACDETCIIDAINASNITIAIEIIGNTTLFIEDFQLTLLEEVAEAPIQIENISDVVMSSSYAMDMDNYFSGAESYDVLYSDNNLESKIIDSILSFTAEGNGSTDVVLIAINEEGNTWSNFFKVNYSSMANLSLPLNGSLNVTENFTSEIIGEIRVGKPVQWIKTGRGTLELPTGARGIEVKEKESGNEVLAKDFVVEYKGGTGIASGSRKKELSLDITSVVEVEFETPGPEKFEIDNNDGTKTVYVSSAEHYLNVVSFSTLEGMAGRRVEVYWEEKAKYLPLAKAVDDGNDLYIEWIVPHLSTQTFTISVASASAWDNGTYNGTKYNGTALVVNNTGDGYTKLLLHFDGVDESTSSEYFKDESGTAKSILRAGNTRIDSAQSKFGGTAAYFDGTGDYISSTDTTDYSLASGSAWTIDYWVKQTNSDAAHIANTNGNGGTNGWLTRWTSNTFYFYWGSGTSIETYLTSAMTNDGGWHHIAVVNNGGTVKTYFDGVNKATTSSLSGTSDGNEFRIGRGRGRSSGVWNTGLLEFQGHIEEVRITKGLARWTSNFDVPVRAYGTGEYVSEVFDAGEKVEWKSFTPNDFQSGSAKLNDDCSDISGWSDTDSGSSTSTQTTFDSKNVFMFDSQSAASMQYAQRQKDIGSMPVTGELAFSAYHDNIGTYANTDFFQLMLQFDTQYIKLRFATDGIYYFSTPDATYLKLDQTATAEDVWIDYKVYWDLTNKTTPQIRLYKNNELTGTMTKWGYSPQTDGMVVFDQNGFTTANQITYIDNIELTNLSTKSNYSYRFSNDSNTWTSWNFYNYSAISETSQYSQYKIEMETLDMTVSPEIYNVSLSYDILPPTILQNYSLLFNGSSYLNWTPSQAGNRTTWTWSGWVKRSDISIAEEFFAVDTDANNMFQIETQTDGNLYLYGENGGVLEYQAAAYHKMRDPSRYIHLVFVLDTTDAVANERAKFYIDGLLQDMNTGVTSTQNKEFLVGSTNMHTIGAGYRTGDSSTYRFSESYMSQVIFIDGQALDPTAFGEYNHQGKWMPKEYNGSYGTNGFYLAFNDSSNIGKDYSGNGNDWTANGFNLTKHQTYDVPKNNFATMNPLNTDSTATLSEGNLKVMGYYKSYSTLPIRGKVWIELPEVAANGDYNIGGFYNMENDDYVRVQNDYTNQEIDLNNNGAITTIDATNDLHPPWTRTLQFAIDTDKGTFDVYADGTKLTNNESLPSNSSEWFFYMDTTTSGTGFRVNFGQTDFTYSRPSGYKTLSSANLPNATIEDNSKYFTVVNWTGNGGTQSIDVGFSPDLVWIKNRDQTDNHALFDTVRGATWAVYSDTTSAHGTTPTSLTSFDSNGFSLASDAAYVNANNERYVAWVWKEDPAAGFDIVNFTGNGGSQAIRHSLNQSPDLIIVKNLDTNGYHFVVYSSSFTNPQSEILYLDDNVARQTGVTTIWNNTAANASHFFVGATEPVNENAKEHIAYLWSEVEGFSKFGSYTGNGVTDGPFVYTGFKPKYIMIKKTTGSVDSWVIFDSIRNTTNPKGNALVADLNNAEASGWAVDFVDNGFKIRSSHNQYNQGTENYIYMAFGEYPIANALESIDTSWMPIDNNFNSGGTDFSGYTSETIENVNGLTLNTTCANIKWEATINASGANFDNYVRCDTGWVSVDSNNLDSSFNSAANITLYGLNLNDPIIYRDGVECTDCVKLSYTSGNLVFNVTGFSNYSAYENHNFSYFINSTLTSAVGFKNATFNGTDWNETKKAVVIEGTGDNYTKLLLHFDDIDDCTWDTCFLDGSAHTQSVTQEGNTKIESNTSVFGGSSAYFDGSGDYVTVPDSDDWNFEDNNFTIDFWFNPTSLSYATYGTLMAKYVPPNFELLIQNGGSIYWYMDGMGSQINPAEALAPTLNTWYHLALVRAGNEFKMFVNGKLAGNRTSSLPIVNSSQTLAIGARSDGNHPFHGYIDELRITKGIARWTENFTVPDRAYGSGEYISKVFDASASMEWKNVSLALDSTTNGVDAYTKLLLHFDGPDDSIDDNDFIDHGTTKHTVQQVYDAKLENTEKVFGSTAAYFDGTRDFIQVDDSSDWTFSNGDFTIDFWIYTTDTSMSPGIISTNNDGNLNAGWAVKAHPNGSVSFGFGTGSASYNLLGNAQDIRNDWHHIAIVRKYSETKIYLFIDGILVETDSFSSTIADNALPLRIGRIYHNTYPDSNVFSGYLDEIRISKGIARWTSNFSVPTQGYYSTSNVSFRSCDDINCDDESWVNTNLTDSNVSVDDNRYFQYKVNIESSNLAATAEVYNASVGYEEKTTVTLTGPNDLNQDLGSVNFQCSVTGKGLQNISLFTDINGTWSQLYTTAVTDDGGSIDTTININSRKGLLPNQELIGGYQWNCLACENTKCSWASTNNTFGNFAKYNISGLNNYYVTAANNDATELMLTFDGPNGTTSSEHFIDSSPNNLVITSYGSANLNDNAPIYDTALQTNNVATDYVTVEDNNVFAFDGNFTIEAWVNIVNRAGPREILSQWQSGNTNNQAWRLYKSSSTDSPAHAPIFTLYSNTGILLANLSGNTLSENLRWYHVAVVRNGNTVSLFVDGNKTDEDVTAGGEVRNSAADLMLTDYWNSGLTGGYGNAWSGFIDEVRISSKAIYLSNFTPDKVSNRTEEYFIEANYSHSDYSSFDNIDIEFNNYEYELDNNDTKLFLKFENMNGTQTVTDHSPQEHTISVFDDTHISQADKYLGISSARFDNEDAADIDYMTIADSEDWTFDSDFTIDMWVNFYNIFDDRYIVSHYESSGGTDRSWYLMKNASHNIIFNSRDESQNWNITLASSITIESKTWYHIAVVRNGSITKLYINGIADDQNTDTDYALLDATCPLMIGDYWSAGEAGPLTGKSFSGYLDNLRITKKAIWTRDFTPPGLRPDYQLYVAACKDGNNCANSYKLEDTNILDSGIASYHQYILNLSTTSEQLDVGVREITVTFNEVKNYNFTYLIGTTDKNVGILNGTLENITVKDSGEVYITQSDLTASYISPILNAGEDASWDRITMQFFKPYDDDYSLILDFEGTMGSTNAADFVDRTGRNTVTNYNDAKLSWDQEVFGSQSLYLDGINDHVIVSESETLDVSSTDFTIDYWFYPEVTNRKEVQLQLTSQAVGEGIILYKENNGNLAVSCWDSDTSHSLDFYFLINETTAMTADNWYHVALTRSGNNIYLFLNGSLVGSATNSTIGNGFKELYIGQYNHSTLNTLGYIDEIRIIKGKAVWTSSFTPPTKPYNNTELNTYEHGPLNTNLSFYVRSCDDNTCNGESWNSIPDYRRQNLAVIDNQYFQYKIEFATNDSSKISNFYNVTVEYTSVSSSVTNGGSASVCDVTNKCFMVEDNSGNYVMRVDSSGNLDIKGSYSFNQGSLTAPQNSFVIEANSGPVAYFDSNGNLATKGEFVQNSSILPDGDDFVIENKTGDYVGLIDGATGDLHFLGVMHYNSDY